MKKYIILSLCIVAAAGIFGCATPVLVSPATPAMTNSVTGVVTLARPAVYTNVPNATVGKVVETGTAISGVIPPPYNGILLGVLGLVSAVSTVVAGVTRKSLSTRDGQLETAQAVHNTIIAGIEAVGAAADAVKNSVAKTALDNGTADAVHDAVVKVTEEK